MDYSLFGFNCSLHGAQLAVDLMAYHDLITG